MEAATAAGTEPAQLLEGVQRTGEIAAPDVAFVDHTAHEGLAGEAVCGGGHRATDEVAPIASTGAAASTGKTLSSDAYGAATKIDGRSAAPPSTANARCAASDSWATEAGNDSLTRAGSSICTHSAPAARRRASSST